MYERAWLGSLIEILYSPFCISTALGLLLKGSVGSRVRAAKDIYVSRSEIERSAVEERKSSPFGPLHRSCPLSASHHSVAL